MQALIDQQDWSRVMNSYLRAAEEKAALRNIEASSFLMTHALVYAYLAGDKAVAENLEHKLQQLDRL